MQNNLRELISGPRLTDFNEWMKACDGTSILYKQKWSHEHTDMQPLWLRPPEADNWSMHDMYLEFNKCNINNLKTRSIHYAEDENGYLNETYGTVEIQLKQPQWLGKIGTKVASVSFEENQLVLRIIKSGKDKNQRPLVYRIAELEIAQTELKEINNKPVLYMLFQPTPAVPKYIELVVQANELQMTILPDELHIKPVNICSSNKIDQSISPTI